MTIVMLVSFQDCAAGVDASELNGATADGCGQAEHSWFHTSCHRLSSGRHLGADAILYWAKIQVGQFLVLLDCSVQTCPSLLPGALPTEN